MPSFDIVSEVDMHAFTNAVDQANRVIDTRFDFKGVKAAFERKDRVVTVCAEAEFQVQQMMDILRGALAKCKIDTRAIKEGDLHVAGNSAKQEITMQHGLETDMCRKIVKMVKESKLKVQAAIQGDQVRITGKKRDDLQDFIALLRGSEFEVPLQFENFRD